MFRSFLPVIIALFCCHYAAVCGAQEADFTFDPEDIGDGSDDIGSDDLSFDVVDTDESARSFEQSRKDEIDLIRVIQRRPFLRTKRLELAPFLGTNINDSLVNVAVAGTSANYYLSEVLGIGFQGAWSLGTETDLFDKVINDYALFPEVSKLQWYATLDFSYVFVYGKFALFNTWIIPWDMYGVLGAGAAQTELGTHPMLAAGIGQRYFMNRWFTVNLELRDGIYSEDYPGGSELVNNLMWTLGVSFYIPPSFEYKMLK